MLRKVSKIERYPLISQSISNWSVSFHMGKFEQGRNSDSSSQKLASPPPPLSWSLVQKACTESQDWHVPSAGGGFWDYRRKS